MSSSVRGDHRKHSSSRTGDDSLDLRREKWSRLVTAPPGSEALIWRLVQNINRALSKIVQVLFDLKDRDLIEVNSSITTDNSVPTFDGTGGDLQDPGTLLLVGNNPLGYDLTLSSTDDQALKVTSSDAGGITVYIESTASSPPNTPDTEIKFTGAGATAVIGLDGSDDAFKIDHDAALGSNHLVVASSGNVGIGTASPSDELHVNASTTAKATVESGDASNTAVGLVNTEATWNLTNLSDGRFVISLSSSGINELVIDDSNGYVGVRVASPASPLHVDQESSTGAVPVLTLDQGDDSEEMIEFIGTIGTGNAIEAVGAKTLTTTHFIKVTLPGGLTRYIPVGTIA